MSYHASAHEAEAAAAESWKRAHPLGVGAAREEGSGNEGASVGAVAAAAIVAAAAAGNDDAMAVAAENADAAVVDAAAVAEAGNDATLVTGAAGAADALDGGEDEGVGVNTATKELRLSKCR